MTRDRNAATIAAYKDQNARRLQCPECKAWIPCQRGRIKLDNHIEREHPAA